MGELCQLWWVLLPLLQEEEVEVEVQQQSLWQTEEEPEVQQVLQRKEGEEARR